MITVFVVDDHGLVREGLMNVIGLAPDLRVVANGNGDAETLRALTRQRRSVLVDGSRDAVDPRPVVHRDGEGGDAGAGRRRVHHAQVVRLRVGGAGNGASGYVLKSSSGDLLIEAIRAAAAGRGFIDPALQGDVVRLVQGKVAATPRSCT